MTRENDRPSVRLDFFDFFGNKNQQKTFFLFFEGKFVGFVLLKKQCFWSNVVTKAFSCFQKTLFAFFFLGFSLSFLKKMPRLVRSLTAWPILWNIASLTFPNFSSSRGSWADKRQDTTARRLRVLKGPHNVAQLIGILRRTNPPPHPPSNWHPPTAPKPPRGVN